MKVEIKTTNCKKCGQEVVSLTVKATFDNLQPKAVNIEASPHPDGKLIIHDNGLTYDRVKPSELAKARMMNIPLHRIHDGNCNKDKKWSKKK